MALILALDVAGVPRKWISYETGIIHKAKNQIAWSLGEDVTTFRGGVRRIDGIRSELSIPSIIAIKGSEFIPHKLDRVILTNRTLFARDQHICAYCGRTFSDHDLSRDHIMPRSRGGRDTWENCITACKDCNIDKDNRTPEEANMQLLYIPYAPNHHENMILQNRRILADQMEFLLSGVGKNSRFKR